MFTLKDLEFIEIMYNKLQNDRWPGIEDSIYGRNFGNKLNDLLAFMEKHSVVDNEEDN